MSGISEKNSYIVVEFEQSIAQTRQIQPKIEKKKYEEQRLEI